MKATEKYMLLFGAMAILGFLLGTAVGLAHVNQGEHQIQTDYLLVIGGLTALLPLCFIVFSKDGKEAEEQTEEKTENHLDL